VTAMRPARFELLHALLKYVVKHLQVLDIVLRYVTRAKCSFVLLAASMAGR